MRGRQSAGFDEVEQRAVWGMQHWTPDRMGFLRAHLHGERGPGTAAARPMDLLPRGVSGADFAQDDPLVASTLAMLQATEREGMVYGTGWDATGIWNYFASFYGHAWLWQGNGRKAAQTLYAFANHASPTLLWREEQSLSGEPFKKVGDMPHNWASAEFIRLVIHLLALDRGDELHLLEGLPREWLGPAMATRLDGVATPFGPLDMTVVADGDGKTATLTVKPLAANCTAIVVHLRDGSTAPCCATARRHRHFRGGTGSDREARDEVSRGTIWVLILIASSIGAEPTASNGKAARNATCCRCGLPTWTSLRHLA